ncbi:MAG: hypothetical protein VX438_19575 [Planctomycetota bacterium]|nr:hypothetical protein [Planctomycetota bacterium]
MKSLPGMPKASRLAGASDASVVEMIAKAVEANLRIRFQNMHAFLRSTFDLKRTEIDITLDGSGAAILESKILRFETSYQANPQNREEIIEENWLDAIEDLNLLTRPEFESGFNPLFTELHIQLATEIQMESLIDSLEALPAIGSEIILDYSFDSSECVIRRPGAANRLQISADLLKIEAPRACRPHLLLLELAEFDSVLSLLYR